MDVTAIIETIAAPARVWSRDEVRRRPSPVPAAPGIYGWFFRTVPTMVDATECREFAGLRLLYIGIAPRSPGTPDSPSRQNLRKRIRTHFASNASGSTLRLTLGCLLAEELGIKLAMTPSGRMTFMDGEAVLSNWMAANAFVTWVDTPTPREAETLAIRSLNLPLNLEGNSAHGFHSDLSALRRAARVRARGGD